MLTTLAKANLYITNNVIFSNSWDTATDSKKTIALNQATNIINNLPVKFLKLSPTQPDVFPIEGQTTTPVEVEEACADIALSLLDGNNPEEMLSALRIESQSIDNVRISFHQDKVPPPHILYGVPSASAWSKLAPYLDLTPNSKFIIFRV